MSLQPVDIIALIAVPASAAEVSAPHAGVFVKLVKGSRTDDAVISKADVLLKHPDGPLGIVVKIPAGRLAQSLGEIPRG